MDVPHPAASIILAMTRCQYCVDTAVTMMPALYTITAPPSNLRRLTQSAATPNITPDTENTAMKVGPASTYHITQSS